ncbi:HlyB/MsbA family ABC transporter [Actinomadura sp. NBRC 104412]|uniref:ABC transporter ATP-binding protein n=1 Tax=Actinomadura sp. NBRC 104412 TaxID=3032203 RepID=UPI0024A2A55D|nr:ABC transporter ATP-binding protein [Actinomadura sp. NBRC 104412]GLZ06805.1 HlyB/MsbA family ABC transporter [Actinomadura sp. NBRC 104412]
MPKNQAKVRPGDLMRSATFAVRLAWRSDRGSLLTLVVVQGVNALGLGAGLLLLKSVLGDGGLPGGAEMQSSGGASMLVGLAVLLGLRSVGGVLNAVTSARQRILAARLDRHVISLVLRAAVGADLPRFEDPQFHDGLQRAVFASRGQPVVVVTTLVVALQAVLTAAAVSVAFVAMAWWLLPFAALSAVPTLRAARAERNASYGLSHDLAENRRLRQYFEQLMTGREEAKEVRALDLGPMLTARWDAQYEQEIDGTVRTQRRHLWRKIGARLVADLLVMAVIGGVWAGLGSGLVDLATAAAALTGLWLLSTRIQMISGLVGNIGDSVLYLKDLRLFAGSDAAPLPVAAETPAPRFASLHAEQIGFTYPGSARPTLRGVTVTLRAGEIVALVGTNGSGKTTLAKILAGLYAPDEGMLLFNNRPVTDPAALRDAATVVFQDFVRYKLPALDNIAFGRAGEPADVARVVTSARRAGAHDFVWSLPQEYATTLGKEFAGGEDLSGGQWQRLALARAFYRNTPFIILDEPTAALDPEAEEELFRHIRLLFSDRTVLLISHRFSTVRGADRIYVLDEGRVIEQGTHDELMARRQKYAALFLTQAAGYLNPTSGPRPGPGHLPGPTWNHTSGVSATRPSCTRRADAP